MIGVFGGTFDPIHFGHLRPALEFLQDLPLQEMRLLPCHLPPHREQPESSAQLRLRMLQAATDGIPGFRVDDRELQREGPSYTVDTLASLREELGAVPLGLVIGMDAFASFDQWHRWEDILDLAHLLVAQRPGWSPPEQGPLADVLRERRVDDVGGLDARQAGCILFRPVTQLEISATAIRELVAAGKSARYLLPDSVLDIIQRENLYQSRIERQ